jgi:hypothetical protein
VLWARPGFGNSKMHATARKRDAPGEDLRGDLLMIPSSSKGSRSETDKDSLKQQATPALWVGQDYSEVLYSGIQISVYGTRPAASSG